MSALTRLGVLTGGGDAPGLNAVIRAVVKSAANTGIECIGLEDSFDGLIEPDRSRVLTPRDVTGILRLGGTILGTTNRGNPFAYPVATSEGTARLLRSRRRDVPQDGPRRARSSSAATARWRSRTSSASAAFPIVGVPKTIDNDIVGTTNCFGFDTAVDFATDAIDRLHTTAEAHQRIMVVEVMGRYAGWIALYAGVAGGADAILIPEIPFDIAIVAQRLRERDAWGAKFSIVVVAEGAFPKGGSLSLVEEARDGYRRAARRDRRAGLRSARAGDRQGNAIGRARPPAARRRADQLRPRAGDAVRRQGGRAGASAESSARWSPLRRPTSSRGASTRSSGRRRPCRWISICC